METATRPDPFSQSLAAMSDDTQEPACIAADLANNRDKAAKAFEAQEANAMRLQLQHQSRDYL